MTILEGCSMFKSAIEALVRTQALTIHEIEDKARQNAINTALVITGGNQTRAARILGYHRNTLLRDLAEMKKNGLITSPLRSAHRSKKPAGRITAQHKKVATA